MTVTHRTAALMVAPGRGILAADESIGTMSNRLEAEGIPASSTTRRDYRALLLTAPGLSETVSGIILNPETFDDSLRDGTSFPRACSDAGVLPGVKVDAGTVPFSSSGALLTEGLGGLDGRLSQYASKGAAFAKWRAVIDISTGSDASLEANAVALARYAVLCLKHEIVPIIEPEVLCTGAHGIDDCADMTSRALVAVFEQLRKHEVDCRGIVLKPNLVTPGVDAAPADADEIAEATLAVLHITVPREVPGVAFLSGGLPTDAVCAALASMNAGAVEHPWELTFSFGRALVSDALHAWAGQDENVAAAQGILLSRCRLAAASHPIGQTAA